MIETNWDASRKAFRKRVKVILYIGIPLFIVSGIIFYNNRDVVLFQPVKEVVAEEKTQDKSAGENSEQITALNKADSVGNPVIDSIKSEAVVTPKETIFDSVRVSGIEFRPDDRPDVILKLSLELFFTDLDMRSEIMLRREEIRVITRKVLHNRDFGAIKKETIEPQIQNAIKAIFDNRNLDDVKIVGLQIEKVQTP